MIITEEGTTNIIKWYQPESAEECKSTDCMKCVYKSYIPSSSSCPFEAWMINHPVEKPTTTGKSSNVLQDQRSAQDILNMCATLQANTMQAQLQPLEDMVNVLDLIIEISEKQDELTEMRHEQSATEKKQDSVQQVQARRYQEYTIDQHIVKADDIKTESVYIPNDAVLTRHLILTPGYFNSERDLAHVITWLTPVK